MKYELDHIDFSQLSPSWYFKPAVKEAIQKEVKAALLDMGKEENYVPIPGVFIKENKEISGNGEDKKLHGETNANNIEAAKKGSPKTSKEEAVKARRARERVPRSEDQVGAEEAGEEKK